jgi:gliding motility-associated-like protein
MKHLILIISIFLFSSLKSQCFEIQSILVDACAGSSEGQNEMVTFQVGSTALNSANLSVNWPNNTWLGLTQNAGTASSIASINATIQGCGFLKEPVAGVLPPNSKVLLITSTAFNSTAQSFTGLTDTLIVLFQTAGNTAGHFANYAAGGGTRTLSMSFTLPLGCTDAVTYDRALLIMQNGAIGAQDGGAVEFTAAGVPTYVNHGCQAPYIPLTVDAGPNQAICGNSSQSFTATASGAYTTVQWSLGSGATGFFVPTNALTTIYTAGAGDNGTIKLYCTLIKACGTQTTSVKDSVLLTITPAPTLTVSPSVATICTGQNATLTANTSAAVTYTWSTGAHTNTIQVNTPGIYTVQVSNSCGSASQTATVNSGSAAPTLTIVSTSTLLCTGQSATLSLNGSTGTYNWSTGATTPSIVVNTFGAYSATVTNSCGQVTSFIQINAQATPTISVTPGSSHLCPGVAGTLTASSNVGNYSWNTGATSNVINVTQPGVYTVSVSNQCGTRTATATVGSYSLDPIVITSSSNIICPNETATLTVTGGSVDGGGFPVISYAWSNSTATGSVNTTNGGTVTVMATNVCGTYSQSIVVQVYNVHAGLTANPVSGVKPLVVTFTNTSTGATTYNWSFGNGMTATGYSVSPQTYTAAGDYTATIVVSDGVCTDNASVIIHVLNEAPELMIPNVFTPNNDLVNDVFKIKGYNITNFKAMIFDRWGLELFAWNDVQQGWDGKVNGNVCNDGTYFYIILCRDADNKDIKKQGSFTLFR